MSTSGVTEYTKTIQRTWTRKRLHISIDLAGEQGNIINTYTTSDRIDGTAAIAADEDVDFDVTFEGIYRVYNERTGPPHTDRRVGASKTFLKLRHPLSTNAYPTSRRFQKGEKFIFPFSFVVPDHMDAPFCMFNSDETHIQLPPTLKGGKLTGADGSLSDDFTPTDVENAVTTCAADPPNAKHMNSCLRGGDIKNSVAYHEVNPGILEQNPGRLNLTASRPQAIRLLVPANVIPNNACSVTAQLQYVPVRHEYPPRLKSLRTKLEVSTTYTCNSGIQVDCLSTTDTVRFAKSIPLSSLCVDSVQWQWTALDQKHVCAKNDVDHLEHTEEAEKCYTAYVTIPITLP